VAEENILPDEFLRQLMNVGEVDLVVAVPTHNHARTIARVVEAVRLGLVTYLPRERAVLVAADGGSRDGSLSLALEAAAAPLPAEAELRYLRTFQVVGGTYANGAGNHSPLRLVLAAADLLQAKACAVLSPSASVAPEWVERLLAPVYRKGFDYVAPLYRRHRFHGLLVRILLYPMVRALYGKRIHEPYAADFAFSGRLGADLLAGPEPAAPGDAADYLRAPLCALTSNYRVCEAFLGPREQTELAADLVPALRQTVGPLFRSMEEHPGCWQAAKGSEPLPVESGQEEITSEPLRLNRKRFHQMFCSGVADLHPVLATILTGETLADLGACAALGEQAFRFPDELWAKTVYECAASFHRNAISRDHLLQAMAPLYRGKVYEFLGHTRHSPPEEFEARVEALCLAFERLKPYLLQMWGGRQGGTP